MIFSLVTGFLNSRRKSGNSRSTRRIENHDAQPQAIYAIGDIHGRLDLLRALEDVIVGDASGMYDQSCIVFLGDIVDRGPNSAQVLDLLLGEPPPGFVRMPIAGNHESMMQDFVENPRGSAEWLKHGGIETLGSYGIREEKLRSVLRNRRKLRTVLESHIPEEHFSLLRGMPAALLFPNALMIHRKEDSRRILGGKSAGTSSHQEQADLDGRWIVHGHSVVETPCKTDEKTICVDTGAYYTDRLSAVRITRDGSTKFLQNPL